MERTGRRNDSNCVGRVWGEFVTHSRLEDIPESILHEAKRSILNAFGTALGAAHESAVDMAIAVLRQFAGPAQATVIGRAEQLDILSTSFVNALSANVFEFDDTHLRTIIHPSAPVVFPLTALAEWRGLSGAMVLHAHVLGVEMACRLGNSVSPNHYARGWHITATCGVFGAAVAGAKLLGLNDRQTSHAIGVAASQSAGLVENLTTGAKNVGVGNAARCGLLAALMAQRGCTAAPQAVEGDLGWAMAMGDAAKMADLIVGLGEQWEIAHNAYKPYPCGIVVHPVIDACFELRRSRGVRAADIMAVTVTGHPLLVARADRRVENERDAKVSIHHSVAVAFLFNAAGLREYCDEQVMDPEVVEFRRKVRAVTDATIPVGAAQVTVTTVGGDVLTAHVAHARGSLELPMSDAEIESKVRELAAWGSKDCEVDHVIDAVWTLDKAADLSTLMRYAGMRRRKSH